jgi:TatA/E family protein of Tat protein translocase
MGNLGWPEILIILVIALIIFGPRKLPELGKTLGNALAQFRRASEDFKRTWEEEVETEKRKIAEPFKSLDEPYKSSYADTGTTDYASASGEESLSSTEQEESSPYWSPESTPETAQTAASVEENLETAQSAPTITPDSQAVPRQTKRDWV